MRDETSENRWSAKRFERRPRLRHFGNRFDVSAGSGRDRIRQLRQLTLDRPASLGARIWSVETGRGPRASGSGSAARARALARASSTNCSSSRLSPSSQARARASAAPHNNLSSPPPATGGGGYAPRVTGGRGGPAAGPLPSSGRLRGAEGRPLPPSPAVACVGVAHTLGSRLADGGAAEGCRRQLQHRLTLDRPAGPLPKSSRRTASVSAGLLALSLGAGAATARCTPSTTCGGSWSITSIETSASAPAPRAATSGPLRVEHHREARLGRQRDRRQRQRRQRRAAQPPRRRRPRVVHLARGVRPIRV